MGGKVGCEAKKMAQQVMLLSTKSENLSWITKSHNSLKSLSDLYEYSAASLMRKCCMLSLPLLNKCLKKYFEVIIMLAGQKDEGEEEDHPGNWEVSDRSI